MATHENAPRNNGVITPEAWAQAAKSRNFRVHDGAPVIEKDGAIAPLPVPDIDAILPLLFHAWAEYNRNRVTPNGVSLADALAKVARNGEGAPSPKSNDAFDAIYQARIAELVDGVKGWDVLNMTKEERLERTKLIDASAFSGTNAAKNRAKYYDDAVTAALAAGSTAGTKREGARKTSKSKESIAL